MANVSSDPQLDEIIAEQDYKNITNPEASLQLNEQSIKLNQTMDDNVNKFLSDKLPLLTKQGAGRLKKTKSRSRSRSKSKSKTRAKSKTKSKR